MRHLHKSATDRVLAGVLGGVAEYFGWDATWTRIGYVILTLTPIFPGIIVYLIAAVIMPAD